jgi:periplasmic protein TonB
MRGMRLPLTVSIAGHASVLALLVLLVANPGPPDPPVRGGIEVALGQSLSQPEAVLAPEPATQPADPSVIAALPPQETAETEPAVSAAAAQPPPTLVPEILPPDQIESVPPPPQKAVIRQPPKTVVRRPQPRATASAPSPAPSRFAQAPQAASPMSQYPAGQSAAAAAMPASVPGPDLTANYQAMIAAWFEAHKRYPDSARQRGEEGSVGLRFRVDRFGRVLDYTLRNSTGYADLDAGIDQMMRGAQLPPFPAGMTMSQIEVSVKIRFSLAR